MFVVFIAVLACGKDEPAKSKTDLLTGGSEKGWVIFDSSETRCSSDADDTWTFHKDGSFDYDNGAITGTATCGDFYDVIGTWAFSNNESDLTVTATQRKDGYVFTQPTVLYSGTISTLDENKLRLTIGSGFVEFHKK